MKVDVGMHMHRDRHVMPIGSFEYLANASDIVRLIDVHIGIPEMKLETGAQVRVFRTTVDLFQSVRLQWVNATKPEQPMGILRHLRTRPVVLCPNVRVFVLYFWFVWVREAVRDREHDSSGDSRSV